MEEDLDLGISSLVCEGVDLGWITFEVGFWDVGGFEVMEGSDEGFHFYLGICGEDLGSESASDIV